ncbi:hypothetical protein [Mucilaginibacter gilvus]|uniref:Uncharacterized protein n=1 Tax=Mucilaginibacter gilvus TaxID=2305909 RepID=A0A444MP88_9SPHI|nr:hypothetical protein [Mucilaginibacter gilvus]RWY52472.1 hypothetical protein EPL05_11240 [Mucilaginibacter gilvus]
MKLIIKYISLLLFSGLILPVCNLKSLQTATVLPIKKAIQSSKYQAVKPATILPLITSQIVEPLLPALKN